MAITIPEFARLAANGGETKKAGILMTFAEQSPLLRAIPIPSIAGNSYKWTREASLPEVAFRQINAAYAESTGTTEEIFESLKDVGGDLDVDNYYVETGGAAIRTTQEMMKAKALAQRIGFTLVKGSILTAGGATGDAASFDGLQSRYGGGFASTAVSTSGRNAGQLVENNGASQALSMVKLDEAILRVDRPTHLLMPKKMSINMATLLRNSSSIQQTKDEYGNIVMSYNGLPILWADINGDQAAIGFNENNDSSGSIYVLNLSADGLHMIQSQSGISVRDLGEQDAKPVWRTRVQWLCGLVDEHPRCVSRLWHIADLPAVN
jgi:hypothetical protein